MALVPAEDFMVHIEGLNELLLHFFLSALSGLDVRMIACLKIFLDFSD